MTSYDEAEIIRTYRNASVKKVAVRTLANRLGISIMEIADFLEDHKTEYFAARELVGEYEQIQAFIERGEKK